jgi:hypothetical protein
MAAEVAGINPQMSERPSSILEDRAVLSNSHTNNVPMFVRISLANALDGGMRLVSIARAKVKKDFLFERRNSQLEDGT